MYEATRMLSFFCVFPKLSSLLSARYLFLPCVATFCCVSEYEEDVKKLYIDEQRGRWCVDNKLVAVFQKR